MTRTTIMLYAVLFLIGCQPQKSKYDDLLDYPSKTSIDLPKANGMLIELNDTTNYHFFYLEKLSEDSIVFWVNGKQINLSDFTIEYRDDLIDDMSILYIDKNIKLKEVDKLFDVLSGHLLNRTIIAVSNENNTNNQLWGIKMFLPHTELLLFKDETAIPPFIFELALKDYPTIFNTYIYRNDSIFLNDEFIEKDTLTAQYRKELLSNTKKALYIYLDSNSCFQSYVEIFDLFYTVAYEVREKYSKQKHKMSFDNLDEVNKTEIRKRYPLKIGRITEEGFINMERIIIIEEEIE
jgi:hypothetical protein